MRLFSWGHKEMFGKKKFCSKNLFLVHKEFWVKKIGPKIFVSKTFLVQKKFGYQQFWPEIFFGPIKTFGLKKIWCAKDFWFKRFFGWKGGSIS